MEKSENINIYQNATIIKLLNGYIVFGKDSIDQFLNDLIVYHVEPNQVMKIELKFPWPQTYFLSSTEALALQQIAKSMKGQESKIIQMPTLVKPDLNVNVNDGVGSKDGLI